MSVVKLVKLRACNVAPPTKAQQEAHDRNFYIFRLRGLHDQVGMVRNQERIDKLRELIDQELESIGAENNTKRRKRIHELSIKAAEGDKAADAEYKRLTQTNFGQRYHRIPF